MSKFIAALPMYDWQECRSEVDGEWASIRTELREAGIDAPEHLVRRNAEMPAVPGGIRDQTGELIAPDPATLPPDELDYPTLWRHPNLLLAQTCWGPLEATDLARHVRILTQPDYSQVEGGNGQFYSSAVVVRRADADRWAEAEGAAARGTLQRHSLDGRPLPASLPIDLLRGARLAFNDRHSMSGLLGLVHDLEAMGESLSIFSEQVETGGHRYSVRAVAEGRADVATVDCRSWELAKLNEPTAAGQLQVVGWTAHRMGLPYIAARGLSDAVAELLASVLARRYVV